MVEWEDFIFFFPNIIADGCGRDEHFDNCVLTVWFGEDILSQFCSSYKAYQ